MSKLPLNVKLLLSSNSPPVPARTMRPAVKSSTLKVFAWPPAFISSNPAIVVTPVTLRVLMFVWLKKVAIPVIFKLSKVLGVPPEKITPWTVDAVVESKEETFSNARDEDITSVPPM